MTDCRCDDTSFSRNDISQAKYFNSSLIASTFINVYLNADAISV
jgi:hypothetical protein